MPRYAVLLRGINVGRANQLAMEDLRALLSGLGHTDVRTYLRSGNAVFTCAGGEPSEVAAAIEDAITGTLGMSVRCVVRTGAELRAVIDANPLRDVATNGSKLLALFLSEAPAPDLLAVSDPRDLAPGRIYVGDRVIYQWCPDGIAAEPNVVGFVDKNLKVTATGRNWNTVTKLAAMLDS
jgi:uncharacterized protein (DUF1697 family)